MIKLALFKKKDIERVEKKVDDFIDSLPLVKKRRTTLNLIKTIKIFLIFLTFSLFLLVLFFIYNYFIFKDIYALGLEGKKNLELSVYSIKRQDFDSAEIYSEHAQENFESIKIILDGIRKKYWLANLNGVSSKLDDLEYLTITGEILSRSINQASDLGSNLNFIMNGRLDFSFSKFSDQERKEALKFIFESGPEIYGIKANIDLAILNLSQFQGGGVFNIINTKVNQLEEQLNYASLLLTRFIPITEILPYVAGYPQLSNFLILFQNNDELRPTGGFLGTYGVLQARNGEIVNFDTHDIYHLDMPSEGKLKIDPPKPIADYMVDKWYLRDSNWSPDWPTSAKKIEWFYRQEYGFLPESEKARQYGGDFQGIIGITPEFVVGLLKIIGPVYIENQEYNSGNFQELLQYRVEQGFADLGISSWERKEVIGEILKEIKIRLLDLPVSKWGEVINAINGSFASKDVLVYFHDPRLKDYAEFLNWDGRVMESEADYLMVVDANLAAYKTDAVVNKKIEYDLDEINNDLFSKLTLKYSHQGGFDWRTTRYRSYTRVYVPVGSKLINLEGDYQGDIETGEELGRTYFGFFISIEPGDIGNIIINYKLPQNIVDDINVNNFYNLYVQKQPGNRTKELLIDLNVVNEVKSYKPIGFNVEKRNSRNIIWKSDFETDKIFQLDF